METKATDQRPRVPPNVKFEIDDAEATWTFQHQFDYVHGRYLAAAISDWPKLIRQSFDATKPGGYAEFQEYDLKVYSEDGSLTPDHAEAQWNKLGCGACESFGKDPFPGGKLERYMKETGFEDVYHERFRLPVGPWPKDKHLVSSAPRLFSSPNPIFIFPLENRRVLELDLIRRWPRRDDASAHDASPQLESGRSARPACGCP